jgi:NADH-quinone oxidoreductase subunit E
MSVRRLDPNQPTAPFAFNAENMSWAKQTIAKYPAGKEVSAVIPVLWRAQEQNAGWVSRPVMEYVADMLNMAYIRVLEVATFYTMFQLSPVGTKAHIQVCGTIACQLRGAEDLKKVCQNKIHPEPHHLNADGTLSWEEVECLGACVNAPMVQVWKQVFEDLTPRTLSALIDDWKAGRPTQAGPQNGRQNSMAEGGASTLVDTAIYGKQRAFTRVEAPPPPVAPVVATAPTPVVAAVAAAPAAALAPAQQKFVDMVAARVKTAKMAKAMAKAESKPRGAPEMLKKPRGGKSDDLKLIWGVGPALEKLLNKKGVWHFEQVASWSATDLKWVDDNLEGFAGRAKRDEWVKQAKKLAKGWRPDSAVGDKPSSKSGKK